MPKAYPDFEEKAEKYLDGELSPEQEKEFLSRVRKEEELSRTLKGMKFAQDAMQVYKYVLPKAAEFNSTRKKILSTIY